MDPHSFFLLDPDPHSFFLLDPDPHSEKLPYPDPHVFKGYRYGEVCKVFKKVNIKALLQKNYVPYC